MDRKKLTFSEPGCLGCPAHMDYHMSRYCGGFNNKKRCKPFRKSDPAYKAPKWCPKRKEPREYRIYGFADEQAETMELLFEREHMGQKGYVFPNVWRYKLRAEGTTGLTPNEFYKRANNDDGDAEPLFEHDQMRRGEVVEIDTGLAQFFFYCAEPYHFKAAFFDPAKIRRRGCEDG